VPAMNIRFTAYDTVRAALRAAKKTNAGALIFEIARSEMSYCELPPAEFSAMVIAAAIKEGYFHPLFIQGDHFQVKAAKYKTDPEGAIKEVKDLIRKRSRPASGTSTSTPARWSRWNRRRWTSSSTAQLSPARRS
jgi:fructose/tagatose bisphosphate aldolase